MGRPPTSDSESLSSGPSRGADPLRIGARLALAISGSLTSRLQPHRVLCRDLPAWPVDLRGELSHRSRDQATDELKISQPDQG